MDAKDAAILRRARSVAFRAYFYPEGRKAAETWLAHARAYSRKRPELAPAIMEVCAHYAERKLRRRCDKNRILTLHIRDKVGGRKFTIRTSWLNLLALLRGTGKGTLAERLYFLEERELCQTT